MSRFQPVWERKRTNASTSNAEMNDVQESECHINNLPHELLNYIFSFLDFKERIRIEIVCKSWRHLSSTITWANMKTLVLEDKYFNRLDTLSNSILEAILRRCGSTLRSLDLSLCSYLYESLSPKFSVIIANHCPNLEEISLHRKEMTYRTFGILAEKCTKLKIVDLSNCNIFDRWLCKLWKHCNVTQLNLSCVTNITGKNFHLMSANMRVLNLNNCSGLLSNSLNVISEYRNIRHLYLKSCSKLSPNSVQNMFNTLGPLLTILDVGGYFPELNSLIFSEGLAKCHNLEELFLDGNDYINDAIIRVVCKNCLRLHTLSISECNVSDKGLIYLSNLDNLRNLFVNRNKMITEKGLRALSLKGTLENVELRECCSIQNEGCVDLLSNCKRLKLLDISKCQCITDIEFCYIDSQNRIVEIPRVNRSHWRSPLWNMIYFDGDWYHYLTDDEL